MKSPTKRKNKNRSITVNFGDEPNYHCLCLDGKGFIDYVVGFIMALGFQLLHKCDCPGGFCLTRHSHYARIRLGGLVIWRLQYQHCGAVFTIIPHWVLRYRSMSVERAKQVLVATYGGLSLEWTATIFDDVSVMSMYRLVCALGERCLVRVLTRCGLALPAYLLVDEKHSFCLKEKVYLPTIVVGRVIWHLGYAEDKSADAFEVSYGEFKQASRMIDGNYCPKGMLTDGFESTRSSLGKLFPTAKLGNCLRHAMARVGQKIKGVASSVRDKLKEQFFSLFQDRHSRQRLTLCSLAQK